MTDRIKELEDEIEKFRKNKVITDSHLAIFVQYREAEARLDELKKERARCLEIIKNFEPMTLEYTNKKELIKELGLVGEK